jgi:hypothetical protein
MLLKMHFISSLIVQIGAAFSLLFIYFNPFVKKMTPFLQEMTLSEKSPTSPPFRREEGISLDLWSQNANESYHYHLTSAKGITRIGQGITGPQILEELQDVELTCQESSKELYLLSSEKACLNISQSILSLMNATILFDDLNGKHYPLSGDGFAESITISSFSSSPSLRMKGFSGYLNIPTEAL